MVLLSDTNPTGFFGYAQRDSKTRGGCCAQNDGSEKGATGSGFQCGFSFLSCRSELAEESPRIKRGIIFFENGKNR